MNCPKCGKVMVEKPPSIIYTSNPPQWDRIMWCGCGYQENMGRVRAKSLEEQLRDEWEKANTPDQGNKMDTIIAHEYSSRHREEVLESNICGCFHCVSIFNPMEIKEWINEATALCPRCGIDSVIGSKSGCPINKDFLREMHNVWF